MRTRLFPTALLGAALFIPAASHEAASEAASTGAKIELVDPDSAEAAAIRRTGEMAINWLGARLVHEISNALAKSGPESAAAIAHLKALATGPQPVPGMPSIKAAKRTSLRLLNAANAPDAAEQRVLDHLDRQIKTSASPDHTLVQRITAPDGTVEWRVYRALAVLPSCLACHGDPGTQSPALQTLLRERAPANIATGYQAGDWRGVLRVTVAPPAPAAAK